MKKNRKIDLQFELVEQDAGPLSEQQIEEILNDLADFLISHWQKNHPEVPKDEPGQHFSS